MGKKKIVLDTNIFISAIGWEGKARELFRRVLNKEFDLYISKKQVEELRRVLEYPKFGFTVTQKEVFFKILFQIAIFLDVKVNIDEIKDDPSDNMLLECAFESRADYIVSGDSHLLRLKKFRGIKIVSVNEFLNHILKFSETNLK